MKSQKTQEKMGKLSIKNQLRSFTSVWHLLNFWSLHFEFLMLCLIQWWLVKIYNSNRHKSNETVGSTKYYKIIANETIKLT